MPKSKRSRKRKQKAKVRRTVQKQKFNTHNNKMKEVLKHLNEQISKQMEADADIEFKSEEE